MSCGSEYDKVSRWIVGRILLRRSIEPWGGIGGTLVYSRRRVGRIGSVGWVGWETVTLMGGVGLLKDMQQGRKGVEKGVLHASKKRAEQSRVKSRASICQSN